MPSPIYHVAKGFFYGISLGMFFAAAIYLLAVAVNVRAFLPLPPTTLACIIFAGSVTAGVGKEYSKWLKAKAE